MATEGIAGGASSSPAHDNFRRRATQGFANAIVSIDDDDDPVTPKAALVRDMLERLEVAAPSDYDSAAERR